MSAKLGLAVDRVTPTAKSAQAGFFLFTVASNVAMVTLSVMENAFVPLEH